MTTQATLQLAPEQLEEFGREIDAIRERVTADLGERDATYIRRVIKAQRGLEIAGRSLLFASFLPPAWLAGTAALTLSKILDNMEIGHNVLHGQYDWMNDEAVNSVTFEWDMACPSEGWRYQHNYIHHTHTNIVGKDRDIGFGIMRMSADQRWYPYHLGNPALALLIALFFEWGAALHDLELFDPDEASQRDMRAAVGDVLRTASRQALKDFALFPALAGPAAPATLAANVTATTVRNLWVFTTILCGHFPEGTQEFTEQQTENETRGEWYCRQLLGSADVTGGPLFHILSGNLGHQIEHHLFADLPAHRYAELSVEVREICERYELPYNVGPLSRQVGGVVKKIFRLALP